MPKNRRPEKFRDTLKEVEVSKRLGNIARWLMLV